MAPATSSVPSLLSFYTKLRNVDKKPRDMIIGPQFMFIVRIMFRGQTAKFLADYGTYNAGWNDDITNGDITLKVQSVVGPQQVSLITKEIGVFPYKIQVPDGGGGHNNELTITFLSTQASFHERVILPWMREVVSSEWIYSDYPYTKADITVQIFDNETVSTPVYDATFCKCYPKTTQLYTPKHEVDTGNMIRPISFNYDYINFNSMITT
jgi:hypothetical protein